MHWVTTIWEPGASDLQPSGCFLKYVHLGVSGACFLYTDYITLNFLIPSCLGAIYYSGAFIILKTLSPEKNYLSPWLVSWLATKPTT